MQRGARIIGAAAALVVGLFILLFVALPAPSTLPISAVLGIAYLVVAAVVLLAPSSSAGFAAVVAAVLTVFLGLVAMANNAVDGLILLTAALLEAGAAWALLKDPVQPRAPKDDDSSGC
jgi:hypothetical protein